MPGGLAFFKGNRAFQHTAHHALEQARRFHYVHLDGFDLAVLDGHMHVAVALDAGDVIPNPELAALRSMPNVILTDHTAFYTHEDVESMVRGVLESAVAFEKGQPTRHDVTDL